MQQMTIPTYAKINLSLDVVGKRENGYHDLKMVMQSVSLHDDVTVERTSGTGISLTCNAPHVPCNESNIAAKAALRFFEALGKREGLCIHLEKRIPMAAGLAGGSGNGAGVLLALNEMYGHPFSPERLREIGLTVGADVPFCLLGGTALAEGLGEVLTPLPLLPDCAILLVKPRFNISTVRVFTQLNWRAVRYHPDTAGLICQLKAGAVGSTARHMYNVLEIVTAAAHPEITEIKSQMVDLGAEGSIMSGSGPTVFGIFTNEDKAQAALSHFSRRYEQCFLCRPTGPVSL